jgi:hypothetical protein
MLSRRHEDCRADKCLYCPRCHRRRVWTEWVVELKDGIVIQLRLKCPNGCPEAGTSFSEDSYKSARDWCSICEKFSSKGDSK